MFGAVIRARDVLGPQSPLARAHPNWELREGQLAMAEAVEHALENEHHLFVEAGTGTGKTLAYLVPAILSGRKVVVSTATRALQDQIYVSDLPLVATALEAHGVRFRAALMKGLANYVCLRRLEEARLSGAHAHDHDFARILTWLQDTANGDRAELAELPEDAAAWREVASSSETRIGTGCDHFEQCFVTRMRREAEDAQIVVVNHHLFLADLALRSGPRGAHASVLPPYDAVVFDEAHQIEDVATDFFGFRVSSARFDALARDAERTLASLGKLGGGGGVSHRDGTSPASPGRGRNLNELDGVRNAARAVFAALAGGALPGDARRVLSEVAADVHVAHEALDVRLEALESLTRARREESAQAIARRTADLRDDLRSVLAQPEGEGDGADLVRWVDVRSRAVSIGASPVDVGPMLRARLFDRVPTVICTSATLATGQSFHFSRARLGAPPETEELVVPSPFDFASRAALYVADDLPDPAAADFDERAADRIAELVRLTGGGAFVLCTSTRAMRSLHGALRSRIDHPLLLQGERPKHVLLSRFRGSGRSVLVATMSFWEGVDVPGWALRLVVLDKIPFAPPNEPIVAARCARIDREGGSGFAQYSVPSAAMTLKQGFGRLIRTQRDAGIVAILDRRITRRGYGRMLLASLPPAKRVRSLAELGFFWAGVAPEIAPAEAPASLLVRHPS